MATIFYRGGGRLEGYLQESGTVGPLETARRWGSATEARAYERQHGSMPKQHYTICDNAGVPFEWRHDQ